MVSEATFCAPLAEYLPSREESMMRNRRRLNGWGITDTQECNAGSRSVGKTLNLELVPGTSRTQSIMVLLFPWATHPLLQGMPLCPTLNKASHK